MLDQPRNYPAEMHRKKLCIELGKMTFYGQPGNCVGAYYSEKGIEVDKAKIDLISKLPSPTNIKTAKQFLGHVGFYKRFIMDFSKIAKPLYKLLEKDAKLIWDVDCQKSFEELKAYLTTVPVVRAPNWKLPF